MELQLDVKAGEDDEEREAYTSSLQRELAELEVCEAARPAKGDAPLGTRSGEILEVARLVVELSTAAGALAGVVTTVRSWLFRQRTGAITMTVGGDSITVRGEMSPEQQRLLELWLDRYQGP